MSRKKFVPSETKRPAALMIEQAATRDDKAVIVAVTAIKISTNPRSAIENLSELKESIKANGILNPLLIAKKQDGFELLGGHRRLQCAKELGFTHVPCRIVENDRPEVVKLVDNIVREALSPVDEITAVARLAELFDGNQVELAMTLGKSKTYVTRCLKAARLIPTLSCAGATLSKTTLFELADATDPSAVLAAASDGKKTSIRDAKGKGGDRQPSGAIPDGRFANPIRYKESNTGWTLQLLWDTERVPVGTKDRMIEHLEMLIQKLKKI